MRRSWRPIRLLACFCHNDEKAQLTAIQTRVLPYLLTDYRKLPRIPVDALRLSVRDNKRVAEEDAKLAVGGHGVRLDHQYHSGLKHLLVLFGLDMVGEDMRLRAYEIDAVNKTLPWSAMLLASPTRRNVPRHPRGVKLTSCHSFEP